MKKIIIYIILIIIMCFFIPLIGVHKFSDLETSASIEDNKLNTDNEINIEDNKIQEINSNEEENQYNSEYDYKEYGIIKLLHGNDGSVQEIKLDEYLYGVVSSEMPANFELEALKAQAVVARTYTIYKIESGRKHENADICDDYKCCQAWITKEARLERWEEAERQNYWNKIVKAVNDTKGKIITYENKPINAFFHSNSGGTTEVPINVWGGSGYPYLQSVATVGEENYTQYSSEVILAKSEFVDKLKEKYKDFSIDWSQEKCIEIVEYTDGTE